MKKSKVLFLLSNDLGYDQRMQKIGNTLAQNGYQVEILFARKHKTNSKSTYGFSSRALPMFFKKGIGFYLELNHRLFWKAVFQKMDIISCVDVDTLLAGTFLKWFRKKKLIIDCHEWYEESPEIINRKWVYKIWQFVAKTFVPKTSVRYTVNDSIGAQMETAYGVPFKSVLNLPNGGKGQEPYQKMDQKTILYQGVLNQGRGLEELIEAMVTLKDFQCVLIGSGDIESKLIKLTNSLGINDRVKFYGKVFPEKLKQLTPTAWIGYNLLTGESKNYYYSLANKFFDYVQAGIPSLNMDYPEYRKYVDQYQIGICVPSCTPQSIVEAVTKLDNSETTYKQMVANCIEHQGKFVWETQEQTLVEIYDSV